MHFLGFWILEPNARLFVLKPKKERAFLVRIVGLKWLSAAAISTVNASTSAMEPIKPFLVLALSFWPHPGISQMISY